MSWVDAVARLASAGEPFVLVTVATARGHTPRGAGAKMVLTATAVHGSIGGGNLEESSVAAARAMLAARVTQPELRTVGLNSHASAEYGMQCCGGEVSVLLEPVYPTRPTVAIFGAGHVGYALVRVLELLPIDVVLVDSRADRLVGDLPATTHVTHAPVPESAVAALPRGALSLVMTHDHAEDLAIVDTLLRRGDLGFIGLIGSATKWARFRRELAGLGHDEATVARVTSPIGVPGVPGKSPAAIAIATAAQLLAHVDLPEASL